MHYSCCVLLPYVSLSNMSLSTHSILETFLKNEGFKQWAELNSVKCL